MTTENALAAGQGGAAPALQLQESIRPLAVATPAHLAQGNALLRRCLDLKSRTPGDVGLGWAAARLITADAALCKQLAKALAPPRRKVKRKRRQRLDAELNSRSSIFCTEDGQ